MTESAKRSALSSHTSQDAELGAKEITLSEIATREEALNEQVEHDEALTPICTTEF